jgi:hypothetical protein
MWPEVEWVEAVDYLATWRESADTPILSTVLGELASEEKVEEAA